MALAGKVLMVLEQPLSPCQYAEQFTVALRHTNLKELAGVHVSCDICWEKKNSLDHHRIRY